MRIEQKITTCQRPVLSQKLGFDIRIVRYEQIHNISDSQFDELSRTVDIKSNETILDAGSGYGGVTTALIERNKALDNVNFWLSDISSVQLERAKREIPRKFKYAFPIGQISFKLDNIAESLFSDRTFDKVVAKMLIHEVKKEYQQMAIDELYRIMKPGGKLILWDVLLNPEIQTTIQSIIRKKDELAGFQDLVINRYLFTEDEIVEMLTRSGFIDIRKEADMPYTLNTISRLDCELQGDKQKLNEWNKFIRDITQPMSDTTLESLDYQDEPDSVFITFPKGIISCQKPN